MNKFKPNFEIAKRYIESSDAENLVKCLEDLIREKGYGIGEGANAEVFSFEHEKLGLVCVKRTLKNPKFKINDEETEFNFQEAMWERGVSVPRPLVLVENTTSKDRYILMERILGPDLGAVLEKKSPVPDSYNQEKFWAGLRADIDMMHDVSGLYGKRLYHRDLHSFNIKIEESTGKAVIIDFGSAGVASYSDEDMYHQDVRMYDEQTQQYVSKKNYPLKNDIFQIDAYRKEMANLKVDKSDRYANILKI
jgi:serine/threonine protein kinase